ncbi:MAG: TraB/GumN family protein [Lewinellaceae bacterium]|nr:TraB/GumN family protein [Saprospiraceae bacterium]MCB9345621.1 TraB/GumN family protein [Lewinellaceae bacterium]
MAKQNSLLWRITPAKGGQDSFLFGTMHVRDIRAFGWIETARETISQCDIFATEFDFSEADSVALSSALTLPEGKTLQDFLSRGAWKQLIYFSQKKLGIDVASIQHMHPMSVSAMLATANMQDDMAQSLDETLYGIATSMGKETTGVETFQDQIKTLHKISFEQHLKNLTWTLKNKKRQQKRMKKMMKQYESGDIKALYQSAKKDAKGMRKILIYDRNITMANRFLEIANEKALFCAVGAGHLAGGKGMLRILKRLGCKVRPVF